MKKRYSLILAFLMMLGVSACSTGSKDKDSTGISSSSSLVQSSSQNSTNINNSSTSTGKKVMEHVLFADAEVVYDGQGHTLEASVYPDGSTVTYLDNGPFVDVGTYVIKVRISHPDYEDYEDTATLVIKAATMSTISFKDETITFDGNEHTLLATGYPEDAVVTYVDAGPFINVGEYEITVRIELANYEPYEETKKLIIEAADMESTGITFEDLTVTYTGDPYTIEATGYPSDATITYTNAGPYTEVGEYEIGLKIEKENYNPITTTATLKIVKGTMAPFTFDNLTVEYDGNEHTIEATGFPEGSLVIYTNEGPYTEIGEYEIQVTVSHPNYETVTETARLTIVEPIEKLKHLKYYAHPYERKGVVIEFAEDYKSAKIYSNDYDLAEDARVSIDGEKLHIYTYHNTKNVEYVDIHANINADGFKVYNVATDNYYNANVYKTLYDYMPQFKMYYGKTYVDFSDSVDGEVYAPKSHVEKYYDGSKWVETSGNAIGVSYTFEYWNGKTYTYQGLELKAATRKKSYRYYHYFDKDQVNLDDLRYYYLGLIYANTTNKNTAISMMAVNSKGEERPLIGTSTNAGDAGWLWPGDLHTYIRIATNSITNVITSDIVAIYFGLTSTESSVEPTMYVFGGGLGICDYELYPRLQ